MRHAWTRFWKWIDEFFIGSSGIDVIDRPAPRRKIGEL